MDSDSNDPADAPASLKKDMLHQIESLERNQSRKNRDDFSYGGGLNTGSDLFGGVKPKKKSGGLAMSVAPG